MASEDLNPIEFASDWQVIYIASTPSPGAISVDGIRGFKRETGWDIKKGKGTKGATLTIKDYPPAEGEIEFQLWLPEHFDDWAQFRPLLKFDNAKASNANALDIYHPSLADVKINSVVVKNISPIYHRGRGLYVVSVEFIEWFPVPAKSIIKTTSASSPTNKPTTPGDPADPIAEAQQKQIKELMAQAASTPLG